MGIDSVKLLAEAIKEYFSQYELEEMCGHYEIVLEYIGTSPNHQLLAQKLLGDLRSGQNRQFLIALLDDMLMRCDDRIHIADLEGKLYHQQMMPHLNTLRRLISSGKFPSKKQQKPPVVRKASKRPTDAPQKVHRSDMAGVVEFFGRANTDVTIFDTELGPGTFDCLSKVTSRINLLTGQNPETLGDAFNSALRQFTQDGRKVEVRRREDLQDRFIVFNNKCWMAGMPLTRSNTVNFKPIQIVDLKSSIMKQVQKMWRDGEVIIIG